MSLTVESVLAAYAQGAFPMTDPDGVTRWYTADPRGVIPLSPGGFVVPKSLRQVVRSGRFEVRVNTAFERTMRACKDVPRRRRSGEAAGSWISDGLVAIYVELHRAGFAHSVECWRPGGAGDGTGDGTGDELVGGLYGVSLGAAFFGESMFHVAPAGRDASKVALVHLVDRLRAGGFELLDTQASTPHLEQFGCVQVPARQYLRSLRRAIGREASF